MIGISISSDRQNQQNVLKLKSLGSNNWRNLVDLIASRGLQADENDVANLLGYSNASNAIAEIAAAKSNMYNVVNHLHDPQKPINNWYNISLK